VLEAIKIGDDEYTRKFFEAVVTEDFANAFPLP